MCCGRGLEYRQAVGLVVWKIYLGVAVENACKYSWLKCSFARELAIVGDLAS